MARHWICRLPVIRGVDRARRVARDRLPRARDLGELRGAGGGRGRRARSRPSSRRGAADLRLRDRDRLRARCSSRSTPALLTDLAADRRHRLVRDRRGPDPRHDLHRSTSSLISLLPDLRRVFQYHAAEHKAINAYEAGEELDARERAALHADPPALRHGVPALGDGDRDLRLRVLRPAGLVLADRDAHPAAAA